MIVIGAYDDATLKSERYKLHEGFSTKTTFFEADPGTGPGPNAFLVKQSARGVIRPHFHHSSQFQVIVHGDGKIGRHEVRSLTVHYAGQQTGYGPIVAGDDGLWYFTLRPITETGSWFLPESASLATPGIDRPQMTTAPEPLSDASDTRPVDRTSTKAIIEQRDDGLAAWLISLRPFSVAEPPPQVDSIGRYYLVVSGEIVADGQKLPRLSCIWTSGDSKVSMTGGPTGAEIAVLQFPWNALVIEARPSGAPTATPRHNA